MPASRPVNATGFPRRGSAPHKKANRRVPPSKDALQAIRTWWRFSERLACLTRPAWRRQGAGASVLQGLDLGEALSAEAKPRSTEVRASACLCVARRQVPRRPNPSEPGHRRDRRNRLDRRNRRNRPMPPPAGSELRRPRVLVSSPLRAGRRQALLHEKYPGTSTFAGPCERCLPAHDHRAFPRGQANHRQGASRYDYCSA